MHPLISIGIYLLYLAVVIFLTDFLILLSGAGSRPVLFWRKLICPLFILAGLLPLPGTILPDCGLKFITAAAGNIFLAFFVYYSGLILFSTLVALAVQFLFPGKEKTAAGVCLLICLAVTFTTVPYGFVHAQNFRISRYEISVDKAVPENDEKQMKIVFISDLHLSVNTHYKTIERMTEVINREDADVVLVGGDILTSSLHALKDPDRYAKLLSGIKAGYGVYAVCGNHDVEEDLFGGFPVTPVEKAFRTKEMDAFFDSCGFKMLHDQVVTFGGIQLAGRDDGEKAGNGAKKRMSVQEIMKECDPSYPHIVLEHEPVEYKELKEHGADLVLSGHTHAGQFFPGTVTCRLFFENIWGYKKIDGLDTIVSSGIGYYGPPMRIGCDSEIAVITLNFR